MPDQHTTRRASYDLHLHTCWSYDAMATVDEHFAAALAHDVRRIAITDHHIVDGLDEAIATAERYPQITLVPGAELTVTASTGSIDVVCLGFTAAAIEALTPVWDAYHEWQREYAAATTAGMRAIGFDYTDEHRRELLESYRPARALEVQGMTHVANKMQRAWFVERGFIANEAEYGTVLAAAAEKVARPPYPAADFVLPAVKQQGMLLIIAHPTGYFQRDNLDRMNLLREELLLDGAECAHRLVPPELRPFYRSWCEEHGLLSSGGSDLHWSEDVSERIGAHGGPDEWWPEIQARLPAGALVNP
ncbi:MAG: PHP domain-containing protein [candidate division WS1 bacterium]|jgi:predicted metal-dependent phosphoesterase TrpH|nr:PHP domain-containing protein [candidate division WS1 bacterium]